MGGTDESEHVHQEHWPWSDEAFRGMQADHERFMKQLRDDSQRLQRRLENEQLSHAAPGPDAGKDSSSSPFANFKKFIDDNFIALTNGFKNFPANVAEVRARMQREQEQRKDEEADISRRWTGSSDSPDHIRLEVERSSREEKEDAFAAAVLLLSESLDRNKHIAVEKIESLYHDPQSRFGDLDRFASPMLSWGGACYYMSEGGNNLPSTRTWHVTSPPPLRWLSVDWFKCSPYSPIRLEAHPDPNFHTLNWRAAFEDLLNASLGKPMVNENRVGLRQPHGVLQSTHHGPGLEWMLSLQCRGILPPQLPRFYNDLRGKRELQNKALSHVLAQSNSNLPWASEPALNFCTPLQRDVSELMSEIGIKSTSESSAPQLTHEQTVDFPATEKDLYDSPFLHPGQEDTQPAVEDFHADMWEAFEAKDVDTLIDILDEWSVYYRDVRGLLHDTLEELKDSSLYAPRQEWVPVLSEALRMCHLKDHEYTKWAAELTERIAELDQATPEEKAQRRSALRRLEDIIGCPHNYAHTLWTTEEIEESVARMEQDAKDPAHKRNDPASFSDVQPITNLPATKKPGVLSALTTTHTTRLPDGTVTTKVVLKRRFADGTEETQESVHTANESVPSPEEKRPEKKGWFWS